MMPGHGAPKCSAPGRAARAENSAPKRRAASGPGWPSPTHSMTRKDGTPAARTAGRTPPPPRRSQRRPRASAANPAASSRAAATWPIGPPGGQRQPVMVDAVLAAKASAAHRPGCREPASRPEPGGLVRHGHQAPSEHRRELVSDPAARPAPPSRRPHRTPPRCPRRGRGPPRRARSPGRTTAAAGSGRSAAGRRPRAGAAWPGSADPSRAAGRRQPARSARSAAPGARSRRSRAGPAQRQRQGGSARRGASPRFRRCPPGPFRPARPGRARPAGQPQRSATGRYCPRHTMQIR